MVKPLGFDSICLAAALDEVQPWVGGRLQRIIPIDRWTLCLGLYRQSEAWLLISLHPRHARAHLAARRPGAPAEATPFIISLRKAILDSSVAFIRQRGMDRIVEMGFHTSEGPWQLVAELTGRHSALILVDPAAKVAAADKFLGSAQSRRPVLPGRPYEPPPYDPKPPLTQAKPSDRLMDFEGGSPGLERLVAAGLDLEDVLARVKNRAWSPHFHPEWGPYPLPFPGAIPKPSFGVLAEAWHKQKEEEEDLREAVASLQKQVERVLLARQTAAGDLEQASQAADRATETQERAELILAYQGMAQPGAESLEVWDYQGQPLSIPLDPSLTALENAQKLFAKAKKAKERKDEVREQLARIRADEVLLEDLLQRLSRVETLEEARELKAQAEARRWLHKNLLPVAKEERPYEGHSIRELISPGGWKVLYGLNSTSNDYLTTKVARPNDWWLHVRGGPSAHVVLQTQNRPDKVQKADLEYAALVAVRNSPSKHSGLVSVDYTLKKHVRKPRKSAPGLAVYVMEKTLHIEPGGQS